MHPAMTKNVHAVQKGMKNIGVWYILRAIQEHMHN